MNSKISYINSRKAVVLAEVDEAVVDDCIIFNEVDMVHEYHHPITGNISRLHSIGDAPALIEGPNNRKHWLWHGTLHRTCGPAFTCDASDMHHNNQEYYVFGVNILHDDFERYKRSFLELEAFAIHNGIDLTIGVNSEAKYAIYFNHFDEIVAMAEYGTVPLLEKNTGHKITMKLSEMRKELGKEERGPGVLASAALGVAALFLASKVKSKITAKNNKRIEAVVTAL